MFGFLEDSAGFLRTSSRVQGFRRSGFRVLGLGFRV